MNNYSIADTGIRFKPMTKLEYLTAWLMSHPFKPISTIYNQHEKIGRNQLCPCGSEIKYKKCCGRTKNEY